MTMEQAAGYARRLYGTRSWHLSIVDGWTGSVANKHADQLGHALDRLLDVVLTREVAG